jgi:dethiobiotin synthetase
MSIYFITGIDTGVGKSYTTGLVARFCLRQNIRTITQKIAQTGTAETIADDIVLHRRLMDIDLLPEDHAGTTCPYLFGFPASPFLAAKLEDQTIDLSVITSATTRLSETFDMILLEGAGGLHVPLRQDYLIADYVQEHRYPMIVVTSGKLGSINHTLLTLEAAANRHIPLAGIVFNHYPSSDTAIRDDAIRIFREQLAKYSRPNAWVEIPEFNLRQIPDIDFSPIFQ